MASSDGCVASKEGEDSVGDDVEPAPNPVDATTQPVASGDNGDAVTVLEKTTISSARKAGGERGDSAHQEKISSGETKKERVGVSREDSLFECDIATLLKEETCGCDLLWSLFVAAARSYRFSSILQPFPPEFITSNEEEKNIVALREVISSVPSFSASPASLSDDCKGLLSWALLPRSFRLKMRERDIYMKRIRELTGQVMDTSVPRYVFEVIHSPDKERRFEQLRGEKKTFYAYHGSRLDNFFSILHNGLNNHLNKVAVFGEGTYLSSELSVSLMYSKGGEGWRRSSLGARLACVVVCEMIDDPSVKCQIKEGSTSQQKQRAQASRITDAVPEKYYVVQNNDVIRVKYLLVYKEESSQSSRVSSASPSQTSWLRDHKFPLLMLAYILLLLAIGLANSRTAINTISRFYRTLNLS